MHAGKTSGEHDTEVVLVTTNVVLVTPNEWKGLPRPE